ncbi:MAG: Stage II sporulation protein E [uncultured Blastococcus sp.]|uniref:Stage II sporulation protein E n=1 Tax=uncultured Blastococcus sp. TaxID=217144 RepID=A0A6J4H3U9_9ACTN|nr:MAG: Stage II sporulation protein E [uncultured Blastococcus sp.]
MPRPERMPEQLQPSALRAAVDFAGLSLEQVWVRYFGLGGRADLMDLDAHLTGLVSMPPAQADVLAHAVNECLDELVAARRVPYSRPMRAGRPSTSPLTALVELLRAAGAAPPDQLPALAASAGRALGVEVTVHLVDHEQRNLVRMSHAVRGAAPVRLALDATMAGRAFRTGEIVPSDRGNTPRLWVPIIDGADRLGVLEAGVPDGADLHEPALRDNCLWLARLLGYLIASMQPYGDQLERARRNRPLSASAELIWQQLPPLTAATDTFVLAGLLEPSYDVGGDVFDYALSETTVSLGIFDAVGHGMPAALMATSALAGYRSARRDARGVFDQARAIDDVISGTFPSSAFVTGVIAEVDLASGRLRYVNAGHPPPVLLRGGKVVKELTGGRRVPFGLATDGLTVAEEALEPGDWLCLYTDGIAEARDATGAWFGEERLMDFLTREISAGQTPPETVRRLTEAVLRHQGGLLQDDATVLLARWTRTETSE